MKKILISILTLFAFVVGAEAATFTSRDIKQPSETKLFISGNHQTPDFEDLSVNKNQFTKVGNVKTVNEKSTTNPKYFPVGQDKGIYFDGSGDYLSIADSDDLSPSSGDFTVDLWANFESVVPDGTAYLALGKFRVSGNQREYFIQLDANEKVQAGYYKDGLTAISMRSYTISLKTWYHIAFVKSGTSIYLFLNGELQEIDTGVSSIFSGTSPLEIGTGDGNLTANTAHKGFLQNIRISKGIARWTSNFTPPALNSTYQTDSYTKLYIKGHDKVVNTTAMTDDSGTSKTITTVGDTKIGYSRGTAAYFDGTGDYLSCPRIDSGDYTKTCSVELWWFPTAYTTDYVETLFVNNEMANDGISLLYNNANGSGQYIQMGRFCNANTTNNFIYYNYPISGGLALNKWHHIVAEFEGGGTSGNVNFWINGTKASGAKKLTSWNDTVYAYSAIGAWPTVANRESNGYINGFKVKEGQTAIYASGNITPPETEPTPDAYTKLLMRNNVLNIRDISATPKALTNTSVSLATTGGKTGTTSLWADTYTDVLSAASVGNLSNSNFTIDWWGKTLNTGGKTWFRMGVSGSYSTMSLQEVSSALYAYVYSSNNFTSWNVFNGITATIPNNGAWNHYALVRNGNNFRLYINGTSVYTTDTLTATFAAGDNASYILWAPNTGSFTNPTYMQDYRCIIGRALWTSNFTPPRRSGAF